MAEKKDEEAKENGEDAKSKLILTQADAGEDQELAEDKVDESKDTLAENEEDPDESQELEYASNQERDRGKSEGGDMRRDKHTKKKKKKHSKAPLITSFKKFIEHKVATTQLYPIEEYFWSGECIQLLKKRGRALLLRFVQTHFKGKDYSAYKRETVGEVKTEVLPNAHDQEQTNPKEKASAKEKEKDNVQGKEKEAWRKETKKDGWRKEEPKRKDVVETSQKFFERRYYLFSKYDSGIQLDEESS